MEAVVQGIMNITDWLKEHPVAGGVVALIFTALLTALVTTLIMKIVHHIFKKRQEKNGTSITARYVEGLIRGVLIIVAVFWVLMGNPLTSSFGDVIFKGSAVVGAIIGFAAQPVISDLISGLILSLSKPFQIGDRIELEDGTSGVVKDISIRHVVLRYMDGREIIVPNSRLNGMRIVNASITGAQHSFVYQIGIAYGSNVKEAMKVLEDVVRESPYTIPGKETPEGKIYAPAYFLEYADSSLILAISIYYLQTHAIETVRSDINLRIDEAFREHNIEIPFNYVNVVMKEE